MPKRPSKSSPRPVPLVLRPLWGLYHLVFKRQLRLGREAGRWRVTFANTQQMESPRVAHPVVSSGAVAAPVAEPPGAMVSELHALLGRHADARQLMRHLAYVERTLRLAGPDGLETLPPGLVQKSLEQLEGLVDDWSTPGLAELRLRLVTAGDVAPAASNRPSDFNEPGRLEVSDASESVFEAAQRGL